MTADPAATGPPKTHRGQGPSVQMEKSGTHWVAFQRHQTDADFLAAASLLNGLRNRMALGEHVKAISCKAAFTKMIQEHRGLHLWGGQLKSATPADNTTLKAAIGDDTTGSQQHRTTYSILLQEYYTLYPTVLSVFPVTRDSSQFLVASYTGNVLIVIETEPTVGFDVRFLGNALQLSESEAFVTTTPVQSKEDTMIMMTMGSARPHGDVLTGTEIIDVDDLILGVRDNRMLEFRMPTTCASCATT